MIAHDIVIRPVITEKSMLGAVNKIYTFEVAKSANKIEIAKACEEVFGVKVAKVNMLTGTKVEKVNTMNNDGKKKRVRGTYNFGKTAKTKKAIVKLTEDSKPIEFFEGMM